MIYYGNELKQFDGRAITFHKYHQIFIKRALKDLRKSLYTYMVYFIARGAGTVKKLTDRFKKPKVPWNWGECTLTTVNIKDSCEAFKSMADGKYYTSKAKYRAEIRARGYEEVGNEKEYVLNNKPFKPTITEEDIIKAWQAN